MSKIDTSAWREFKLCELLKKVETVKIPLKKSECSDVQTEYFDIPARTATSQNQGLSCYVPHGMATILKNKISVSANGDFCAFWHDTEFTILQDSYALEGNGFELTKEIALFLINLINAAFSLKYNWNNKSGWEKLKEEKIKLPVKETEEIDWEFMEDYIKAIQKIVIKDVVKYKDEVIAKTKEAVAS